MRQMLRVGLGALAALPSALLASAWAQVPTPAPTPSPVAPAPGGQAGGGAVFVLLMLGLFVIIGIGVKLYDLRRKRSDEAMHLQARIADTLMLDPALATLPVAASVRAPMWRGSPVAIELTGHVPSSAARDAVMNVVVAEASRAGAEFHVEDHLAVESPRPSVRAA